MEGETVFYLGGGGSGGVFGAGIVSKLEEANAYKKIKAMYGSSAGAFDIAFFLARQSHLGSTIYWENLVKDFIFPSRIFSGTAQRFCRRYVSSNGKNPSNVLDIDYLMDIVKNRKSLDVESIRKQPIPFYIKVLDTVNGNIVYLDGKENTLDALKATASAIPYYFPINQRYVDADISRDLIGLPFILEKHPDKRIVVVLNYTKNQGVKQKFRSSLEGVVASFMYPEIPIFDYFHGKIDGFNQDIKMAEGNDRVLVVSPPIENPTEVNTTDAGKLKRTWEMGRKEAEKILEFMG